MTVRQREILGVIPIRGTDPELRDGVEPILGDHPLFDYTFNAAREAQLLSRVVIVADGQWIADRARQAGLEAPFLRPAHLSEPNVSLTEVLQYALHRLEKDEAYQPDWLVLLEVTHPFRSPGLIDRFIETVLGQQIDSAFLAYPEPHSYWLENPGGAPQLVGDEADVPRGIRRKIYRDVGGMISMFRAEGVRAGRRYGQRLGLIPFEYVSALVDLHDVTGQLLAELLADQLNRPA